MSEQFDFVKALKRYAATHPELPTTEEHAAINEASKQLAQVLGQERSIHTEHAAYVLVMGEQRSRGLLPERDLASAIGTLRTVATSVWPSAMNSEKTL